LSTTRFVASFVVRFSQKFQKIFTRDAAESLWEHACRWTHPVSSRRILGTIDRAELKRLREHYPHRPNARKINAYEDADYWVGVNIKRVQDLWLDRSPPLHLLDLGCGPGYFLYLCGLFGHEGIATRADAFDHFCSHAHGVFIRCAAAGFEPHEGAVGGDGTAKANGASMFGC